MVNNMAEATEDMTISIVVPRKMFKELSDFAKKNDCSVSALIRRIVREWQEPLEIKPRLEDKNQRGTLRK